jgi:hypothetical protein
LFIGPKPRWSTTAAVARELEANPEKYADAQNPYVAANDACRQFRAATLRPALWAAVERELDAHFGCD